MNMTLLALSDDSRTWATRELPYRAVGVYGVSKVNLRLLPVVTSDDSVGAKCSVITVDKDGVVSVAMLQSCVRDTAETDP